TGLPTRPDSRRQGCRPVGKHAEGMARERERAMRRAEPTAVASPRSGTAEDAELFHAGLEGRSLEAQDSGGAALTADPPSGLVENRGDVPAFEVLQAARLRLRIAAGRSRHEFAKLEAALGREDDRPLDDVLQFAHVAGPGIGGQAVQPVP